jgi:putative transcriptional regulator
VKNLVRQLRVARNWSQSDLGARLAVSRQTINAIEAERYDPSLPLAFKIARLFGRAVEEVFDDAPADNAAAPHYVKADQEGA